MSTLSLYNDDIWNRFTKKFGTTINEFHLKTYPQLDPYFNFFERSDEIKDLVSDTTLESVVKHPFIPFVKILVKTPRYRYQENEGFYSLDTKIRPISFASHLDTYLYAFYSFAITEIYQEYILSKKFSECILAYRTDLQGKCNIQFAKDVFNEIDRRILARKSCTTIALDISGYFDNIDHLTLKEKWCKVIDKDELPKDQYKIFKSLTKYAYINKNSILKHFNVNLRKKSSKKEKWQTLLDLIPDEIAGSSFSDKLGLLRKRKLITTNLTKKVDGKNQYRGIPQGSPMSALLSNIYLVDFDELIFNLSKTMNFHYRRYCDDILIICDTNESSTINAIIHKELEKYHLTIQQKKAEIIEFTENSKGKLRAFDKKRIDHLGIKIDNTNEEMYYKNLQYLGFEHNGSKIYLRPGSLSRFFRKAKSRIVKTISMAYSNKSKIDAIYKRQLYERYTHFGKRNFITYAQNSARKTYENAAGDVKYGMDSLSIKKQLASHFSIIEQEIIKTNAQRFDYKEKVYFKKALAGKKVKTVKNKY